LIFSTVGKAILSGLYLPGEQALISAQSYDDFFSQGNIGFVASGSQSLLIGEKSGIVGMKTVEVRFLIS
jgi:hypothetical protein